MERQIPIYFNDVSFSSPLEPIANIPTIGKTKVRVFTKYRNRNGSYITDEMADQLIASAISSHVPVVGFFDKENGDFTTHVPEDLANAYGFCDEFLGWEKHLDEDGVEREYATFSVFLFTNYFSAANKIVGNPQSMELDPDSIEGNWVAMDEDGTEYFVYEKATMKGFTVLGKDIEPCFQGAAFFSNDYNGSRFDKFSALLEELQKTVENIKQSETEVGGKDMNFYIQGVDNENYTALFTKLNSNFNEEHNFEVNEIIYQMDDEFACTFACGDRKHKKYSYSKDEEGNLNYELVEECSCDELRDKMAADEQSFAEERANFETALQEINDKLAIALQKVTEYEAQLKAIEDAKKQTLIDNYADILTEEDIAPVKENIDTYSYDEVERELAVCFARKNIAKNKSKNRVPLQPEDNRSDLEKLMEKYRKN